MKISICVSLDWTKIVDSADKNSKYCIHVCGIRYFACVLFGFSWNQEMPTCVFLIFVSLIVIDGRLKCETTQKSKREILITQHLQQEIEAPQFYGNPFTLHMKLVNQFQPLKACTAVVQMKFQCKWNHSIFYLPHSNDKPPCFLPVEFQHWLCLSLVRFETSQDCVRFIIFTLCQILSCLVIFTLTLVRKKSN